MRDLFRKQTGLESVLDAGICVIGIGILAYSEHLRDLAQAGLINYSYWQGVGSHWGVAMAQSTLINSINVSSISRFSALSLIGTGFEISQYFSPGDSMFNGRASVEDCIGGIGGAFIAVYGAQIVMNACDALKNYSKNKTSKKFI
jgi:hypothetical protein